ncbi:hypothetical protein MNBD_GAMMA01-402 [hydrothermal vent metagenome]|uniref:Membrane insertase YidC/Oxa/ALB C-terminal domain-containing protein n=1 Tax=hydrothermal vent metagenome TaxID=652676 RepID=A0A3B0VWB3_9ZZZZ
MTYLTKSKFKLKFYFLLATCIFISSVSFSQTDYQPLAIDLNDSIALNEVIDSQIKENYIFSGLATYLNQVQFYLVDSNVYSIDEGKPIKLNDNQLFAISGRYKVLLITAPNSTISIDAQNRNVLINTLGTNTKSVIISKDELKNYSANLNKIRYNQLWAPFAYLARLLEDFLVSIKSITSLSWGYSILLFALLLKIILIPISTITAKSQEKVSKINSLLQPKLKAIKSNYDGEEAHNKIMQAHKDLGVTPFFSLKPMLSFFIQIPVLITVFNTLGEMPQLVSQPFLWFDDLSKPDMLLPLGFNLPFFGSYLNLMPILMTIITLITIVFFKDHHASSSDNKKQKLKLYFIALAFLILFFPFPAAMVMYWAMANLFHFIQQKLIK